MGVDLHNNALREHWRITWACGCTLTTCACRRARRTSGRIETLAELPIPCPACRRAPNPRRRGDIERRAARG